MKSKLPFLSWHFSTWNDNNVWNTAAFSQLEGETAYSLKMESKKIQGPYWSWMHPVTVDLRFHTSHYSLTQFYVYRLGIEARRQTHQVGFLPLTHNPSHNYSYIIIPKITPSLCLSPPPHVGHDRLKCLGANSFPTSDSQKRWDCGHMPSCVT